MSNRLKRSALVCAMVAATVGTLPGCAPLLFGGAVVGGVVASDRRTTGTVVEDEGIELRAAARIREQLGERAHVNLLSYNRQVLITGEVPSAQDKQLVEQLVSSVENVRSVVNDLGVLGNSTFTQRSSDTLVTGRVKASLVDTKELYANAFRVTTERGTTYLMGKVTQREAKIATDVVSSVSGVQRVVRVLEIISDEELARIQTMPAGERANANSQQ